MDASLDGLSDELLVEAVKSGDDEAFAELIRRYKRKVLTTASRFVRNSHELDDIGQDVFLKVFKNIATFRGEAPFEHWLLRIAVHTCYDFIHSRRNEKFNVPLDSIDFALEGPSTRDEIEARHARAILDRTLPMLKPEERLAITLLDLEGNSVREVAGLTGWSEANVRVRAFRARQALKKLLGDEYETR